jgi:uncharacterized protein YndB with AHSA1/START domain
MFIDIQTQIKAPLSRIWAYWTDPLHIVCWNFASTDWHTPRAANDLRVGGKFSYRMESKDGKTGFDMWGVYTNIAAGEKLEYELGDGRKVSVIFEMQGDTITIKQSFEPESENSIELQRTGWQAILDNFKVYAELNAK